jgi:hypothetical protein
MRSLTLNAREVPELKGSCHDAESVSGLETSTGDIDTGLRLAHVSKHHYAKPRLKCREFEPLVSTSHLLCSTCLLEQAHRGHHQRSPIDAKRPFYKHVVSSK